MRNLLNKVLVTDGQNKNTLAVIHSLYNLGYDVDVTTPFSKFFTLCTYSKYCNQVHAFRSKPNNLSDYGQELFNLIRKNQYDAIIPVGLNSNIVLSKYKKLFLKYTKLIISDWDKMQIASDKYLSTLFVQNLKIPVPESVLIKNKKDIDKIRKYPVVLKPLHESGGFIRYCNNQNELLFYLKQYNGKELVGQEYVKGFGCGFYGVYLEGELLATYMHKRLKEFPLTGGPSVIAESFYNKKLYNYGHKIAKKLCWSGPIMVEFKYDEENDDFKLIEINPKLWGSLDLTIKSGVDVPQILMKLIKKEPINKNLNYNYVRYRWLFPDEFKTILYNPSLNNIYHYLFDKKSNTNISSDFLPLFFQMIQGTYENIYLISKKKSLFPHGVIINTI